MTGRRPMIRANLNNIGEFRREGVADFAFATVQAVRRTGTATTGVIELKRANDVAAPGVAYSTAQTITLSGDNMMLGSVDVRDHSHLVFEVTTTAAAEFDLYLFLTPSTLI